MNTEPRTLYHPLHETHVCRSLTMTDTEPRTQQRPLSDAEAAVFDAWFGPASDGTSVAVRRAIRDGLFATLSEAPAGLDRSFVRKLLGRHHRDMRISGRNCPHCWNVRTALADSEADHD